MLKCNLRQLLFDRNMNQSDLYRKTGIRLNTIHLYFHSIIKRMNVDDLTKICDTLHCDLSDLIEYKGK